MDRDTDPGTAEAQDRAERSAAAMWAADRASQALGIRISDVRPGRATATMQVTEDMVNGHGIAHGGYVFLLADTAFAFACNSYDQRTVAQHCSITYVRPARLGQRLTAHAVERSRSGRSGIYDVTVTREEGFVIAEFRGHSRTIEGKLVPGAQLRGALGAKV